MSANRELPAGTVTFLFTDVEGSTRLLHRLGDAYAEVLGEHRRVLRECFDRHGGVEVDTQGDAFFVAFARASDALAAAADGAAALEPGPIRVRMGVHTGEPVVTDEGYVGMDVHRAARIAAAGHGGQILVSQSTHDLAGVGTLRDLGDHRLKDLTAPERIYQLGPDDFPPLKSLNQTNLPEQPGPLVGRIEELREVVSLIKPARILTLTGAGGSGKTRLALQAAAEVADDFPDGVWFVSLAALADAELVHSTVASALGAQGDVADFLKRKRLLLLLDNLEQLLPEAAPKVAALLEAPEVKLLTTSRERLAVAGEQEYTVPTLRPGDAVDLFTQRARQLKPSFEPDDHVAEIVRRVDGLPLAVELAAARIKVLTAEGIARRLDESLALLTAGTRDAPRRQQTLRATIDWSYDLLDRPDQQLLARLAVFAGSFDLESAEIVCEADLDGVQSLVDKSLLRETESGRFFMLETIREYAMERFDASRDQEDIRRRHADLALERAIPLLNRELRPDWYAAVDRDYPDFRAALTWLREIGDHESLLQLASRLGAYWDARLQLSEGRLWLEEALAVSLEVTPERGHALATLGHIRWRQGDLSAARSSIDSAEAVARHLDDEVLLADAFSYRGGIEYVAGNLVAARSQYESAIALHRAHSDLALVGIMEHDLGLISVTEKDYPSARRHFEESLQLAREIGRDGYAAGVLGSLGYLELEEGNLARADIALKDGLRLALDRGVVDTSTAHDLYTLAAVTVALGDPSAACVLIGASDWAFDLAGMVREPPADRARADTLRQSEAEIGPEATKRACARGSTLTVVEAVEFALSLD
jgi:predicted ATPase